MKKYAEAKHVEVKLSRRKFLSGGASLSASAVVAATIPQAALAATDQEASLENTVENKEEGYRLTQHIADYYKSAAL